MTTDQFQAAFKVVEEYVRTKAGALAARIDRLTFEMLVNCLKSEDPQAVKEAIDQLAKEKRPLAIAPLYVVAEAHPNAWVRQQARNGLRALISDAELAVLTNGTTIQEAVQALIGKYGHYRS